MVKLILSLLLLLPGYALAQAPLDLQPFSRFDSRFIAEIKADYTQEIQKLKSEKFAGTCQDRQKELNDLKTADLEQRNLQADLSLAESFYSESVKQQAYSDMMLPSLDIELAELNLKICRIHQGPQPDQFESGRQSQQLYCYRDAQLQLNRIKVEWEVIDGHYSDLPGQAFAEKMRIYNINMPADICE